MAMVGQIWKKGSVAWCAIAFFFLGAAPGFWVPAVGHLLEVRGDSWLVPWAFVPSCLAALLSPLAMGAFADQRMNADRLMVWITVLGAAFLWLAFRALAWGWSGWWFVGFMFCASLISAPMWSLLATISMRPMKDPEKGYPLVRLGGTVGWIVAGFAVGYWLKIEGSPVVGTWAAGTRLVLALCCLMLPTTPPEALRADRTWKERLGLGALSLLRDRSQRVYFVGTALLSVPLTAFYPYTPMHLAAMGDTAPTATMALGQISEIVAMLLVAGLMVRFRLKWLVGAAFVLAVVRFGIFASVDHFELSRRWLVAGVLIHGVIYTFHMITGQVFLERRVPKEMRAQAQALLSVMAMGIGGLIGHLLCSSLYHQYAATGDWATFWWVLTAMCAAATGYYLCRDRSVRPRA